MAITEMFGGESSYITTTFIRGYIGLQNFVRGNSAITYTMWYGVVSASTHLFVLLVTTQLPGTNGYTGGKVVFVDTEV